MVYSKTTEYAIRALAFMATSPEGTLVRAHEISQKTSVPYAYIAKTFQVLVGMEILESRRGPDGGFSLRRKPSEIRLIDIMKALDDTRQSPLSKCVMGLEICGEANPCPLHSAWAAAKKRIMEQLEKNTLLDMADLIGKFPAGPKSRQFLSRRMRNIFKYDASPKSKEKQIWKPGRTKG